MFVYMGIFSLVGDFFALDIGTSAIRAVQLKGSNPADKVLVKYGSVPIDVKQVMSNSAEDRARLANSIRKVVDDAGIATKNVVLGVPSQTAFTTIADIPKVDKKDLDASIRYQADQFIPMPLEEVELDWALLGDSPKSPDQHEVLLASVPKVYAERQLDLVESVGLNLVALEPDSIAIARALLPAGKDVDQQGGAVIILDVGEDVTDLVIAYRQGPRLVRSIQVGMKLLVKSAMQNLSIDEAQAKQFVLKFGLSPDKLDGQIRSALKPSVDTLVSELIKSTKFFQDRYVNVPIEKIVVTGGAAFLPDFPPYLANSTRTKIEIGNSWQNVSFPKERFDELIALSHTFGVAAGLGERV